MISRLCIRKEARCIYLMLSRLSLHKTKKGSTLPGMDTTVHEVEASTNFSSVSLSRIREATATDKELQILKSHIMDGFPTSTSKCPEMIKSYFPYRDELTVYNSLVLKGNHIVIPAILRNKLLTCA